MGPVRRLLLGFGALAGVVYLFSPGSNSSNTAEPPPKPIKTAEQVAAEEAEKTRKTKAVFLATAIKHGLRDPESLRWQSIGANDDATVVCAEYRARNGFGGYDVGRTVYANGVISSKPTAWKRHCAGNSFHDLTWVGYSMKT